MLSGRRERAIPSFFQHSEKRECGTKFGKGLDKPGLSEDHMHIVGDEPSLAGMEEESLEANFPAPRRRRIIGPQGPYKEKDHG